MERHYDVAIIGGGIIGTALLYTLSRYTNVKRILLVEKENGVAQVTSSSRNNSQTLHVGDIETNYTPEKINTVKQASSMLTSYVEKVAGPRKTRIMSRCSKMLIGVGEEETEFLEKRYSEKFMETFPDLVKVDRKDIARLEPNVVKGRNKDESLTGVYSKSGHMVAFDQLAKSFVDEAIKRPSCKIDMLFGNTVSHIDGKNSEYYIYTGEKFYTANSIAVCAGSHSLRFAKSLGYGKDLSILAVAGNFYSTPKVVNSKVYTVQKGNIPFLGVHADPDINRHGRSRFGPTITLYPYLEKEDPSTFIDYLKSVSIDAHLIGSLWKISKNKELMDTFSRNISYTMPGGIARFVKYEVQKIIPSLSPKSVIQDRTARGIRAQPIDKKRRQIVVGEVELKKDGSVFNISPSPGASSCLKTATENAEYLCDYLGMRFDKDLMNKELGNKRTY